MKKLISCILILIMIFSSFAGCADTGTQDPDNSGDNPGIDNPLPDDGEDPSDPDEPSDPVDPSEPDDGDDPVDPPFDDNDNPVDPPADPGEGDTTTPDEGDTTTPDEGDTTVPGEGDTTTPDEGDTTTPDEGDTTTPGEGDTTTPDEGDTTTPDEGDTTPDEGDTTVPDEGDTTTPDEGDTTTPGEGDTTTPDEGDTTTPDEGDTTTPDEGDTTTPGEGDTTPGDGDTTIPGEGDTTTPDEGDTTVPDDGDNTESEGPGFEENPFAPINPDGGSDSGDSGSTGDNSGFEENPFAPINPDSGSGDVGADSVPDVPTGPVDPFAPVEPDDTPLDDPFAGAGSNDNEEEEVPQEYEIVTKIVKKNGRAMIEYLGKPFPLIGGQIRLDGLMNRGTGSNAPPSAAPAAITLSDLQTDSPSTNLFDRYILEAKNFGLNCVQVPICWKWVEPSKDVYNFDILREVMRVLNKYDMKMELLWFGPNMCGDSFSFHLPDYIFNDDVTYSKMSSTAGNYSWMYGERKYVRADDADYQYRERLVIDKMMSFIYTWNKENGLKYPIISVQVHNETDNLFRWRGAQSKILSKNGLSHRDLWDITLSGLDNAGKQFKASDYKIITRVNLCVTRGVGAMRAQVETSDGSYIETTTDCYPHEVYNLEGIDIVGDDPYVGIGENGEDGNNSVQKVKNAILEYSTIGNNYSHIAENKGAYTNTASLILVSLVNGGGYNIYDFATPTFFTYMNGSSTYVMDQGVINGDFTDKSHSAITRSIVRGLSRGAHVIASEQLSNIVGYNVETDMPVKGYTKTSTFGSSTVRFVCQNGGLGYLVKTSDSFYVYCTEDATITFNNVNGLYFYATSGAFDTDTFVCDKDETGKEIWHYLSGEGLDTLDMKAGTLYRVQFQ